MRRLLLLFLFLLGCEKPREILSPWQEIVGRDDGESLKRIQIYRAKVASGWIRKDPSRDESISDTMKPVVEYLIQNEIRLTVHTFPLWENRIPPQAQIQRWKGQFQDLDPLMTLITPQSHGGFTGLFLEAQGMLEGKEQMMLGWSMVLATEYETRLKYSKNTMDDLQRADYTIKVVGPVHLVNMHRKALMAFADSFELIPELPSP